MRRNAIDGPRTVRLDILNPGHYFACIGLGELASAKVPEKTLCNQFAINCEGRSYYRLDEDGPTLAEVIEPFRELDAVIMPPPPLHPSSGICREYLPWTFVRHGNLVVDWWMQFAANDKSVFKDPPSKFMEDWWAAYRRYRPVRQTNYKFWAGNVTVTAKHPEVVRQVAEVLKGVSIDSEILYSTQIRRKTLFRIDSCFMADPMVLGSRPDKTDFHTLNSPLVDLLLAAGLQRVMPPIIDDEFVYRAWTAPVPQMLSHAACVGDISLPHAAYRCQTVWSDYYRTTRPATGV